MKKILKQLLSMGGYEIRNKKYRDIYTIRQTMQETFDQIKSLGFYPDLVIDIGTADGTPPLQSSFPDAYFFWAEPLEEFKPALDKLKQKFRGDYVIAALGKEKGEMGIVVENDKVGSSLLENLTESNINKTKRKVPVLTLNDIAREKFTSYSRIILKVDVQGFEREVLEGAADFLNNIDVIVLEVSLFSFLKNCPEFYDIVEYMKKKGFVVYDIIEGINRPLDNALAQKDLVFVKESGFFRTTHQWS